MNFTFVDRVTPFYTAFLRNSWNRLALDGVQTMGMNLKSATSWKRVLLLGILLGIGLALTGYVKYRTISLSSFDPDLAMPRPPISLQPSRFPCLASRSEGRGRRRVVVLRGPDWTLDSTVDLKCFPEREVVLSVDVNRHFLPHPVTDHIRFWIAKRGDVICAKIVDSNASQKLDMDALDLLTNHKCGLKSGKDCRVQSARVIPRID